MAGTDRALQRTLCISPQLRPARSLCTLIPGPYHRTRHPLSLRRNQHMGHTMVDHDLMPIMLYVRISCTQSPTRHDRVFRCIDILSPVSLSLVLFSECIAYHTRVCEGVRTSDSRTSPRVPTQFPVHPDIFSGSEAIAARRAVRDACERRIL